MKPGDVESKILAAVALRGDASIPELAKLTKLKPHIVRYAINTLFEDGLLKRRVVINPFRLGYSLYGLWFSLSPKASRARQKIIAFFQGASSVVYCGEFGGEYSFKIDVGGRTPADLSHLCETASQKFGEFFSQRLLSCTLCLWDFPFKFLAPSVSSAGGFRVGTCEECVKIDERDHQILRMLSVENHESNSVIARQMGIGLTTLEYRIRRLREKGVIVGYHVWPEAEGMHERGMSLSVHRLRLSRCTRAAKDKALAFAMSDPAVYNYTESVGAFDLEMCSAGSSVKEDSACRARLEAELGDYILTHEVVPVMKHHKVNNYPFD